jgi:hypothetical protein
MGLIICRALLLQGRRLPPGCSRSGRSGPIHGLHTCNIPDREMMRAFRWVVVDNFPNGKLSQP